MSSVLYYSNFCDNCKSLLQTLSKSQIKDTIHYFCIDKRVKKPNGTIYLILENGQEIILPPSVTKVPALMLLNKGHETVMGKEAILRHLRPQDNAFNQKATNFNGEPCAFSLNCGNLGVVSDNYSFLDQSSDDLSAKGNGGTKQMYHYATLDYVDTIETPPDNYAPDKIGNVSIEKLQETRNKIQ